MLNSNKSIQICVVTTYLLSAAGLVLAQEGGQASSAQTTAIAVGTPAPAPSGTHKKDTDVTQKTTISGLEKENKELQRRLDSLAKEPKGPRQQEIDAAVKEKKEMRQRLINLEKAYVSLAREKAILEAMCSTFSGQLRSPEAVNADEQNFDKVVALNLGYAYGSQGRLAEAIREYRKALARDPLNKDIHYNLACLFARQKKYKAAIEEYKQALKGSGQDAEVYAGLAVMYATALKDQKTANEFYQKFLEISSKKETPS